MTFHLQSSFMPALLQRDSHAWVLYSQGFVSESHLQADPDISFNFPWGNHKTFSRQQLLCKGLLHGSCSREPLHYSEVPGNMTT